MACALTQGYTQDCDKGIGGVRDFWWIAWQDVTTVTNAEGVVTAIVKVATKRFWKWNIIRGVGVFEDAINSTRENGTLYYTPSFKFAVNRMQANIRNELMLAAKNNLMVVLHDQNDKYWLLGYRNGLDITGGKAGTGTAGGDRNGYDVELSGEEPELALEVQFSVISTLETPGV